MRGRLLLALAACAVIAQTLPPYCGRQPYDMSAGLPAPPTGATLIQVQAFLRHGDRTTADPPQCWPNDSAVWDCDIGLLEFSSFSRDTTTQDVPFVFRKLPIAGQEYWPGNCLLGQLTSQGYQQHIQNGQDFAAAYIGDGKLLPVEYDADLIYLRSDDEPRTMQSAEAVFYGMYPNAADSAADGTLLVNLHYMDETTDTLNPNAGLCPVLATYFEEFENTTAFSNFKDDVVIPLMIDFSKIWDVPAASVDTDQLYDCYYTHVCHNFSLPEEVPATLWEQVLNATYDGYSMLANYPTNVEMGRVSMGPFISQLNANWVGAMNGTDQPVFYAFVSHDTSVMPLLSGFGLMNRWTPYAGYVVFELYSMNSSSDDFAIRMIVYGEEVVIPGCTDVLCPWSDFSKVLAALLPGSDCSQPL